MVLLLYLKFLQNFSPTFTVIYYFMRYLNFLQFSVKLKDYYSLLECDAV